MNNRNLKFEKLQVLHSVLTRKVDSIVVHCSATKFNSNITAETINQWHIDRGFDLIGYHFFINLAGEVYECRDLNRVGAHVENHNVGTIGICYAGGLDGNMKPKDTRNLLQKKAMRKLIIWLIAKYGITKVLGHRDYPKVSKACPCFNAVPEYADLLPKPRKKSKFVVVGGKLVSRCVNKLRSSFIPDFEN